MVKSAAKQRPGCVPTEVMLSTQNICTMLRAEHDSTCQAFPRNPRSSSPPAHPSLGVLRLMGPRDPRDPPLWAPGTLGLVGRAHAPDAPARGCLSGLEGFPRAAGPPHAPGQGARSAGPLCSDSRRSCCSQSRCPCRPLLRPPSSPSQSAGGCRSFPRFPDHERRSRSLPEGRAK